MQFENLGWLPALQFPKAFAQETQGSPWLHKTSGGAAHVSLGTRSGTFWHLSRSDQGLTLLTRSEGGLALLLGQKAIHTLSKKRCIQWQRPALDGTRLQLTEPHISLPTPKLAHYTLLLRAETRSTLAGVVQWIECWPAKWKVTGWFRAHAWVVGVWEASNRCISRTWIFFSLLYPSLPLSLKINK